MATVVSGDVVTWQLGNFSILATWQLFYLVSGDLVTGDVATVVSGDVATVVSGDVATWQLFYTSTTDTYSYYKSRQYTI